MSEKKNIADWLSDFNQDDLKKSAELEIKPKLTIEELGIEYSKDIEILSNLYQITIPKKKAKGKNVLFCLDVLYNGIQHQFIAEASSFRYQLGTLMLKQGLDPNKDSPEGICIKLWKEIAETKNFGKAEVYQLVAI